VKLNILDPTNGQFVPIALEAVGDAFALKVSGGGGEGGGALQLVASQMLTSSASEIVFTNLPQSFDHLEVIAGVKTSSNSPTPVLMQINGDTGVSNYQTAFSGHSSNGSFQQLYSSKPGIMLQNAPPNSAADRLSVRGTLHNYASIEAHKQFASICAYNDSSIIGEGSQAGVWRIKAPVTELRFIPESGMFEPGTKINLYGIGASTGGGGGAISNGAPSCFLVNKGPGVLITDALRLTARWTASAIGSRILANVGHNTGKRWFEMVCDGASGAAGGLMVGIAAQGGNLSDYVGKDAGSYSYYSTGEKFNNNQRSAYGAAFDSGVDVVRCEVDFNAGNLEFFLNGVSQGVAFTGLSGTYYPAVSADEANATAAYHVISNFGWMPSMHTPTAGFLPWQG
jgi:hypothetical protein